MKRLPKVSEDFVQYVWKFGLFDKSNLQLSDGSSLTIIKSGTQNFHGGPDFLHAKVKIDETIWAGNVEIHNTVNEWKTHHHDKDAAYNNLILHVVYDGEAIPITLENGRSVLTLKIGERIFDNTLLYYNKLFKEKSQFIPCENELNSVDDFIKDNFLSSLIYERLERKVRDIENDLAYTQGDIDMVFMITLFKYFGAPANKEAFELLARSFSMTQLQKQNISTQQLESFLFGLAGLLNHDDDYALRLLNEFEYTKKLFKLHSYCNVAQWKFSGVRPANFPTIRIAQLAALLHKDCRLFSSILTLDSIKDIYRLFTVETSPYWDTHYTFSKSSTKRKKSISLTFKNKILINVIVPTLFFYGKYTHQDLYIERALRFLEDAPTEKNSIIKKYTPYFKDIKSALHSQALLTLNKKYCKNKKCLQCTIGYEVLKQK